MTEQPLTLTLPSPEDASLISSALRARSTDIRAHASEAAQLMRPFGNGRPWVALLAEVGQRALDDDAQDLDDLAALIEQQSTPEAQDEAAGRRQ